MPVSQAGISVTRKQAWVLQDRIGHLPLPAIAPVALSLQQWGTPDHDLRSSLQLQSFKGRRPPLGRSPRRAALGGTQESFCAGGCARLPGKAPCGGGGGLRSSLLSPRDPQNCFPTAGQRVAAPRHVISEPSSLALPRGRRCHSGGPDLGTQPRPARDGAPLRLVRGGGTPPGGL